MSGRATPRLTGPPTGRRGPWFARCGLVVLVLLGVVAMHQLGGGDHMSGMTSGPAMVAQTAPSEPAVEAALVGDEHSMPMCLGVVSAFALLVLVRVGGMLATSPASRSTKVRPVISPPGRGPPRDLLAQLCVLRT